MRKKTKKRNIAIILTICLAMMNTLVVFGESNYNSKWLEKGSYYNQSFQVYNTHTGSVGVTLKVESSSPNSWAQIYLTNPYGLTVIYTVTATPAKGDIRFTIPNGVVGNYTVHFDCYAAAGMRVLCWTY